MEARPILSAASGPLTTLLHHLGAAGVTHSGRTLLEHLAGTAALLRQWGCSEHVAAAGMYHSIYGTNAFSFACQSPQLREEIVAAIGREAEHLVYLFAISHRPSAWLTAFHEGSVVSRLDGSRHPVTGEQLRELITIECANLVEQGAVAGFVEALLKLPASHRQALISAEVHEGIIQLTEERTK